MKVVVILALVSCMVAYSLAQMMTQQGQQQGAPNFFQMMMMKNMFDMNWLPLMYMSSLGGMGGGMGGMGMFPLLLAGNM